MTSPSDLLKKANTAEYVLHTEPGGQRYKNPAYYMQPPTANASVWSSTPLRRTAEAPPPALSAASAKPTPEPSAQTDPALTIRPPEIPKQYIAQKQPSVYTGLMKKHDRFTPRHT